jgi:hypothetical protein
MTCSLLHLRYIQALLSLPVFIAASIFISGDKTNSCEGQFLIFLPIFTYFVLSYFVFAPQRFQKTWALLILEGLTWFFWFVLRGFPAHVVVVGLAR